MMGDDNNNNVIGFIIFIDTFMSFFLSVKLVILLFFIFFSLKMIFFEVFFFRNIVIALFHCVREFKMYKSLLFEKEFEMCFSFLGLLN